MRTRILVAIVALAVLMTVFFVLPGWALPCVYALLMAIAQYELLVGTGLFAPPVLFAAVPAAMLMPLSLYFGWPAAVPVATAVAVAVVAFAIAMKNHKTATFAQPAGALFSAVLLPLCLSLIMPIRLSEYGIYLLLLPYLIAWTTDSGAYFIGSWRGKHKLCPAISPKKSVEGAVAGLAAGLLCGGIYGAVMQFGFSIPVNWAALFGICLIGSAAGQFGDLMFSFIKRTFGIKDYGKMFPGHGGIVDRCDSIVMTTAVVWLGLQLFPRLIG